MISLSEILEYRTMKQYKVYCIETKEDLYVVKGSYIIKANTIYDSYFSFIKKKVEWDFLKRRVNFLSAGESWQHINDFGLDTIFDIENVFADGEHLFCT